MCGFNDIYIYNLCCLPQHKSTRKIIGKIIFGLLLLGSLILMIVLLAQCINKKIEQSDVGFVFNTYTGKFSGPYGQGTINLSPQEELKTFTSIYQQKNEAGVTCLTQDKLQLSLDVSYQYAYNPEYIVSMLIKGFSSETNYMDLVNDAFWKNYTMVCANYTAENFYAFRSQIEKSIYNEFVFSLTDMDIGLDVKALQLTHVNFPREFSNIITAKQTATQEITTYTYARQGQLTNAQTELLKAQQQAQIILINAANTAANNRYSADINYNVVVEQYNQKGLGYGAILNQFGGNITLFLDYLEMDIIRNSNNEIISVGDAMMEVNT